MGSKIWIRCTQAFLISVMGLILSNCTFTTDYRPEVIRREFSPPSPALSESDASDPVPKAPPVTTDTPTAPGSPLTLNQAITLARQNNPDLGMATARIQRAQADLAKTTAPYYPSLSVYTEYMQGDAPSAYLFKTIDQRQLPPDTNFNDPGWFENWESGVRARWNLYAGGRNQLQRQMAASGETLAQWDRHTTANRLVAVVIQAFYDARAAKEFIKTAAASVATVESQLRVMNVRFQAGGALKSDILSLEVRLAQAREALVRSRNQDRIARAALTNVLGIEPDPNLELVDETPGADTWKLPAELPAGLAYAIKQRPELAQVAEQLRQRRMAMDVARSSYLPRVDLEAKYYLDDPDLSYSTDRDNWVAAVILNWDFFTGFSTRADLEGAKAAIQEVLAADRKALLEVKFDVQRAYLNLEAAAERLKVALSAVDKAEESLELVKKQYEGGSATVTRYLEAELDRNQARIRAIAARYDQEKARAEIGRAIGFWHHGSQPAKDAS